MARAIQEVEAQQPFRTISGRAIRVEIGADGVAMVAIDVPGKSVNTLSPALAEEMKDRWAALVADPAVKAIVIASGKADGFIAGADVDVLKELRTAGEGEKLARDGQRVMGEIAAAPKPVVVAIHGAALGGGLELALACAYRIATDDPKTRLGLPEIQLGLIPGAGGTQRLPRLVGARVALDLILTGKHVPSRKALAMGLVDEVVPAPILKAVARTRALEFAGGKPLPPRGREAIVARLKKGKADTRMLEALALEENPLGRRILFQQAEKQAERKSRGNYPAVPAAIDAVRHGLEQGMEKGLAREAQHFGDLAVTEVARQLTRVFLATTALKKETGVDDPAVQPRPVQQVGLLGGGLMGGGIAYVTAAMAGVPVRLKDKDDAGVGRGLAYVRNIVDERRDRKSLSRFEHERILSRITGTVDYSGLGNADVVIEAVFEDLALKHRVIQELEAATRPDCIIASNTSTIPIGKLAEASRHPETVVGMHYFSPVHKMPLLEVIVAPKTAPWVVATAVELGRRQGKTVIVVRDGPGFYTSRILAPYINEAAWLLAEGGDVAKIDDAMVEFGFPVGPLQLLDEVGIDVAHKASKTMLEAFGDRMIGPEALQRVIDDGRLGRKNGRGFYTYGTKKKGVDESIYDLLPGGRKRRGIAREDVQQRLSLQMCNEAALCLQEGILRSPRDGDIGAIFGLGFPPFRGGPFRYMDVVGAPEIVRRLRTFEDRLGKRFKPAQILVDMAQRGETFYR
jgi:3-hydroxyacyl-CoA dehydrogenase/enoyl-CoA hydratase/3-hydroxybutyryl-CoA epimerase